MRQLPNNQDGDAASFMHVRVTIDITQPLCHGRIICLYDDQDQWVSFKYERLPNICYWCGCLTHDDQDCEIWIESEGTLSAADQQFGPWLHAQPYTKSRKNVISIPGFYAKKKARLPIPTSGNGKQPEPVAATEKTPIQGGTTDKVTADFSGTYFKFIYTFCF